MDDSKSAKGEMDEVPASRVQDSSMAEEISETTVYLTGWRLIVSTSGLLLCLYLVNLEVTIVSTSLVSIANDLSGFEKANWIVTGYLITYTGEQSIKAQVDERFTGCHYTGLTLSGFIIVWTKLSDIVGRKAAITATMMVFSAFSAGCGASKTIEQLIVFRALQGIGAAGAYSMSILTIYDMVPRQKLALNGVYISISIAFATLCGPIFAGAINLRSTWRWVFYLNVPAGALAIVLLLVALPAGFGSSSVSRQGLLTWYSLGRLDFIGAFLLLGGSLLLTTAFQETSIDFTWSSPVIISMLVLSGTCWIAFFAWEWFVTTQAEKGIWRVEPVFPWRFLHNRAWVGMLLTTLVIGAPFNVAVVSLPQRFQTVSGMSVLDAGLRLIPFSVSGAFSSALANLICSRARVAPLYFLVFGATLDILGNALLSSLPVSSTVFPGQGYAYEIITAAGIGTTFGILVLATPFMVEPRDLAVATGAIIQFRFLGGAVGLSIAGNILNSALKHDLTGLLTQEDLDALLVNIDVVGRLTGGQQEVVRASFAGAYRRQFQVMCAFTGAQMLSSALLFKKGKQLLAA